MARKRDLDALEDGEFSFTADHIVTKRSKFGDSRMSKEGGDSYLYIVGDSHIHQSSTNPRAKKRTFDDLDDEGDFNFIDNHVVSKKLKSLSSYQGKEYVPPVVENKPDNLWCTQIADELTEYIAATSTEEPEDSSWSTCTDDEVPSSPPSHEPYSDNTCPDEDMMDVDDVTLGTYDPTEGIYDAILSFRTKDCILSAMRERTLHIIQILNNPERSKKYPGLWLRSLSQILHAVIIAVEKSLVPWQLTPVEVEGFHKIAAVMESIAIAMPDWNKPKFPIRLLRNVDRRFRSDLQVSCLLVNVISYLEIDGHMTEGGEASEAGPAVYDHDGFFDSQIAVDEGFDFWRNDGSNLRLGNMEDMFHFRIF